jgi:hypothetical protein
MSPRVPIRRFLVNIVLPVWYRPPAGQGLLHFFRVYGLSYNSRFSMSTQWAHKEMGFPISSSWHSEARLIQLL